MSFGLVMPNFLFHGIGTFERALDLAGSVLVGVVLAGAFSA